MRILVTAGSTRVMIDQVRCISNIFRGRTGRAIAEHFAGCGHDVTLLTSDPCPQIDLGVDLRVERYRTYSELYDKMEASVLDESGPPDVVVHSAAVSDYRVEGTYIQSETMKKIDVRIGEPDREETFVKLRNLDASKKVDSEHEELFLKLEPTEKIVDVLRQRWGYEGILVKFKLQVGMTDEELLEVAEASRVHSKAEFMVANCLEWSGQRAYVLSDGSTQAVSREELPMCLLALVKEEKTCWLTR